jgi:hypothetical protein
MSDENKKLLIDPVWWKDCVDFIKNNKTYNTYLFDALQSIKKINDDRLKWREWAKKWEDYAKSVEVENETLKKKLSSVGEIRKKTPTTEIKPQKSGRFPTENEAFILNKAAEYAKEKVWEELSNVSGDFKFDDILDQYNKQEKMSETIFIEEEVFDKKTKKD